MLKKYKNEFLIAIHEAGLDPSMFEAEEGENEPDDPLYPNEEVNQPILFIRLRNSPIKFLVREVDTSFHKVDYRSTFFAPTFISGFWYRDKPAAEVLAEFKEWLEHVAKKYIEDNNLPDYWSQLKMYGSQIYPDIPEGKDSEFTEEAKAEVRDAVKQFRAMIADEFEPTPEQSEFIKERLDYLCRAVERLNRFDWNGVAVSVVMSIAVNLSVDTERGRVLFNMFKAAFQATTKLLN
ncbi:MAG: hypothetical protein AABN95_06900 [Acidobacteriota bacterium]